MEMAQREGARDVTRAIDFYNLDAGANPDDVDDVLAKVRSWTARKRSKMKDRHVRAACSSLHEQGWARRVQV